MKFMKLIMLLLLVTALTGCVFTKVLTMPMRVGGAVISVIPGVGNQIDAAIDTAADGIDDVPL